MLPHLIRLGLFLFALFLANPASSAPLPPDKLAGGWQEVNINNVWMTGPFAASDSLLVIRTAPDNLMLIDAAGGVVKEMISKPTTLASAWDFAKNAGFIDGRLVVVSPTRNAIRIDEYNPSLSRWERSSSVPEKDYVECGPPILFRGEIRVQGNDNKIRRWSLADWSPLPTLTPSTTPAIISAKAATRFGDLYLKGCSSNKLFFEGPAGEEIVATAPLPRTLGPSTKFASSESYFVSYVRNGFLVWSRLDPTAPPRYEECNYQGGAIMNDRYLVALVNGALELRDLKNSSQVPLDLAVPGSILDHELITAGNGIWRYTSSPMNSICHLQLPASSQAVKISVADANAHERNGVLEFEVRAEQALTAPITVNVETSPGTALEGTDYVKLSQTVTLTPLAPSAKVRVDILQDNIVEGYETMFLKVTGVSDGWCLDTEAVGTIIGTGLVQVASTEAAAISSTYSISCIELESGVVLWDRTKSYVNFCPRGQRKWIRLKSTGTLVSGTMVMKAENKNRFLVATGWDSLTYREIDPVTDTQVSNGIMPYPSNLGQKVILNDELYLTQKFEFGFQTRDFEIRRRSDSGFVRLIKKPGDLGNRLITGTNGTAVFEGLVFHRLAPDGTDLYQRLPVTGLGDPLMGTDGIGIRSNNSSQFGTTDVEVIDSDTATFLEIIQQPHSVSTVSVEGYSIKLLQQDGVLRRFERLSGLPAPVQKSIAVSESDAGRPIQLEFTESSGYPVTVSISPGSSSADLKISSASATLPAGQRTLTLPITVMDDEIPETDESHDFVLKVASNGASAEFDFRIVIKDNDILPLEIKDPVKSSAADIGKGYPVFGFATQKAMADPVTETLLTPKKPNSLELFAHTVAGISGYAVSGSPASKSEAANSVYIFDRKKRRLIKQITYKGAGSGFGSTLFLTKSQVFVGAPGSTTKTSGFVSAYTLADGKSVKTYKQPGEKPGNRFGTSIASDNKTVWVGAPGSGTGMAYQFDVKTGKLLKTVKPPVSGVSNFGHSMAVCGSFLAIGAPSANASSSVFIYQLATGKYVGRVTTPFSEGGWFGASLAGLGGNRLAIGCPKPKISKPGAVLIYDISKVPFHLITMLAPSPATAGYGVVGNTGSLSGQESYLMMQFHSPPSGVPLAPAYEGTIPRGIYSQIVAISGKTSQKSTPTPMASAATMRTAMPFPTLEEDHAPSRPYEIKMTLNDKNVLISTAAIQQPAFGNILTLETSDNLVDWHPVARTLGSGNWMMLAPDAVFDADKEEIQWPINSGSGFFRFRLDIEPY